MPSDNVEVAVETRHGWLIPPEWELITEEWVVYVVQLQTAARLRRPEDIGRHIKQRADECPASYKHIIAHHEA